MNVNVEASGGLDAAFGGKKFRVSLPTDGPHALGSLIEVLAKLLEAQGRSDMFVSDQGRGAASMHTIGSSSTTQPHHNLRNGILVLVNDSDWELLGREAAPLQENDTVCFISTLHGG
eukprot:GHVU01060428.1.p3 GENE.GHVU01060428.1~~GHVU01060428.1.p3  ORF type:complete len:117 (+),score=19.39 GHVU01060428.1:42-392(+)